MRGGYVLTGWQLVARAVGAAIVIIAVGAHAEVCELYPIALPASVVSNVAPGTVLSDIFQSVQSCNFGWLTWAGSPSEPTLVTSLTAPGNAASYINPDHSADRQLSVGDWVRGKPGVSNSKSVRDTLDALKSIDLTVPVWNQTRGQREGAAYRVSAFVRVRILSYHLPGQNRITARFLGFVGCDVANQPPVVDAGPDQTISLPAAAILNGAVTDDGLPAGGALTALWSVPSGPGPVTFSQPSTTNAQAITSATFSAAGTYVLRLTANDSQLTASDEVIVTVNRDNHPPVADSQSLTNLEDAALEILLTGGDPNGDALSFLIVDGPSHGTLTGLPPQVQYTPYADYNGPDSFTFKVNDGLFDSAVATITITNTRVNDVPVADSQSPTTGEDTPLAITLSGADVEGCALTYTIVSGPAHGTLSTTGGALSGVTNHLTYTPASNYNGPDGFTFTLNDGELDSAPAIATITVFSINDVPLVDAGADQVVNLLTPSVTVAGSVTDDFFDGSTLTVQWSVLSGPAPVAFANPSANHTAVAFGASGIYTLRLTAGDGFLVDHDDVVITVNASPVVDAGTNQSVTLPASVTLRGIASDDGVPTNAALTVAWSKASGPGAVVFADPASLITTASFGENGIYVLRLTASDDVAVTFDEVTVIANRAPIVDAGSDQFGESLIVALNGTITDDGLPPGVSAAPLWTKVSGPGEATFSNPSSPTTSATFSQSGVYLLRLSADDSLATSRDEVAITINAAPFVNAGLDQTVFVGEPVTLTGTVVDDGVPVGAPVTLQWEVVSGPGTVILSTPDGAQTLAQFSAPGTYVIRLTASDTQLSASGEVVITVLKPNEAPLVSAGQSQLVVLPAAVSLNGFVTDDGLPQGAPLTAAWSKVSGPGSVAFANSSAPASTATFSEAGNYVLRLTASDSELSSFSEVRMAVRTPAMNAAPVVLAGPDKIVGLTNTVTLCGTVTDDGLPQGATLAVAWTKVSGPGGVNFENAGVTNAKATFSELGNYILRLSASDSTMSASDDVSVTVYPFNQPPVVDAGPDQVIVVPEPALLSADGSFPKNASLELSPALGAVPRWNLAIGQPGLTETPAIGGDVLVRLNAMAFGGTNLYVSGNFRKAGGVLVKGIARWDGVQWYALYDPRPSIAANPASPPVGFAADGAEAVGPIAARGDEVFASGGFLDDHGNDGHADLTARWNGTNWVQWEFHNLAGTVSVRDIAASSNLVVIGGEFLAQPTNGVPGRVPIPGLPTSDNIVAWDGTNWLALGSGLPGIVRSVAIGKRGEVYAAGDFNLSTPAGLAVNIAVWNGTNWARLGSGISGCVGPACRTEVHNLTVDDRGQLYAAGDFADAGGSGARFVARWDGTNWFSLGGGVNGGATATATHGRDVYVGGGFTQAGGFATRNIAKWNGQFWSPLGSAGTNGLDNTAMSLAAAPNGIYVGGGFSTVAGEPAGKIAFWEFPPPPAREAQLAGSAKDDGLPPDAGLAFQWTKVSGPGDVTFANAANPVTSATFSAAGTYVLRLVASDTDLSGFDDVTVNVRANQPPAVRAGPDSTIGLTESATLNGLVSDDGLLLGAPVPAVWTVAGAPTGATVTFANSSATNTTARFTAQGVYVLRLMANDAQFTTSDDVVVIVGPANQPPAIFAFGFAIDPLPTPVELIGSVDDDGRPAGDVVSFWCKVSGPGQVLFADPYAPSTRASFTAGGSYVLRLLVTDGELTAFMDVPLEVFDLFGVGPLPGPGHSAPVVNAGPDLAGVTLGSLSLTGTVSDDGLPVGSSRKTMWLQLSGPAPVYFADANAISTSAAFYLPGTYVLRLTATDGQLCGGDDVTISIANPINEAPFAIAGPDLEIVRPNAAELFGVALDDGLPLGYPLVSTWSKISGPGTVAFTPSSTTNSQPIASATFSVPGTYVLRLTVSDSFFSDFDDLVVNVQEGTNQPPALDGGPDLAIALPNIAILPTTATDDGLPQGILEVTWNKASGPGGVSFSTLNGIYRASFSAPGEYVLRLSAFDGGLTSTDDLTVTVYDEPHPPTVAILSPADGAIITAPTVVTGTVSSSILRSWQLEYRLQPAQSDSLAPIGGEGAAWTTLATGSVSITASPLATFDPTLLLNGLYELRLSATDLVGRTSITEPVTVIVDRNMKVGHFTLSFNDLTIPMPGIPIQVIRTYDSRDKGMGDFGIGWTLDLKNIRLQKNRHLGRAWDQITTGGVFPNYCVSSSKARVVTITFPDGRVQKFQMTPTPVCQALSPLNYPDAVFVPIGGNTRGTLTPLFEFEGEIVTDEQLVWAGDIPGRADFISYERLLNPPPGPADNILFNSDLFEYRSQEGYRYVISETNGLRSVTDPNGNTLTITADGITWTNAASGGAGLTVAFLRDALGRITNIVDALGHAMAYRYDTNSNLITFTDRDGNTNGFTYDGRHSLLTLSDGRGVQAASNDYDVDGRLLRNADASGHAIAYSYDLPGQRTFVTNRLGYVTVNEFDPHGNVIRTTNPLGAVSSFVYDENDNLLVKSNANHCACAVSYTYDQFDNRISETDARGNTTTYSYNALRKILRMTEPSGFSATNTYDVSGNLLATIDSAGQRATFNYNSLGKVIAMTDPKGEVTRFAYNEAGFLTNEVNALGHVTEYEVDANGNRLSQAVTWSQVSAIQVAQAHRRAQGWMEAGLVPTPVTVVAGTNIVRLVMRHEYTPSGQPLRTLYYDGSSTEVRYNKIGKKEVTVDQLGRQTSFQYDDHGRVERISHPNGCEETFQYDAEGQMIRSTDRRGKETDFIYDPIGKLINTRFADGSEISASYYADGSLQSETAKNGEVTLYEIDADGNRTSVNNSAGVTRYIYNYKKFATAKVDPLSRTNFYEYDVLGRNTNVVYPNATTKSATFSGKLLTTERDQNSRTTVYGYDALGRLGAVTNAAGEVMRFTYDELGNKTSETDPLGHATFFEYDSMRRLTRTVYPDGTSQSTQYDVNGRVTSKTDQDGNVTRFGYDLADNVTAVTNAIGGVTLFTYDCGGNKLSQTEPDGKTTKFQYDSLNRLTRTLRPCLASEITTYDIAGRVVARTDANGKTTQFDYDLRNNLVRVVDPLNRTNSFSYDAAGNRIAETDANGHTTTFAYDGVDRRVRTTYPDTTFETYAYDGTGRFLAHTDQRGRISSFENDAVGRLIAVKDPLGRVTRYAYDANGNRIAETNANNLVTRHEYDELGRRTHTIYPDGSAIILAYDRLGLLASEADATEHTTFFAYDELRRLTGRQDHLGNVTHFGYDPVGRLTSQTDANNQTTTFEYDCLGRRNRIIYPDGSSQSEAYDLASRRINEIDANTNASFFAYDASGRLLAATNALGHVTQFGYDALDRLISRTDALGRITTFEYDALGRRTRTVYPDGASQTAGYDSKGRRIRETDPAGNSTFYAYDDNDRLIAVTNALNQVTLYSYDATGRIISETDALGRATTFEYDALDRRTRTVFGDGTSRVTTYDVLGRRVRDADQAGVATTYAYDAIGRLIGVTNALGQHTLYGFDPVGRLVAQTNASGQVTTFAYDSMGRRVRRALPGGQSESYGYDPGGNLICRTNFNGHVIQYDYDRLNRLTAKVPDAQLQAAGSVPVTYAYNPAGLRTNITDAGGVTDYSYDVRDRLIAKTVRWTLLSVPTTLSYGYDTNGNLAAIRSSNPNGADVTYTSDPLNRLSAVHDSRLGPTTYSYDPVGNLQSLTRPNGLQSLPQYDSLYRLTNLGVSRAAAPVAGYEYTVGPAGHRLSALETLTVNSQSATLHRSYGYDAAYRLTSEAISAAQHPSLPPTSLLTYDYDAIGNRIRRDSTLPTLPSAAHTYDSNNRLLSDRYDANGNTTNAFVFTPLAGQTNEVFDRFDFEDRLFERTTTLNSQSATIHIAYDGDGNRVAKTVVGATHTNTTLYVVDDLNPTGYAQVLEELTSVDGEPFAVTRVYTWGHALLSQDQVTGNGQGGLTWLASFHGHDGQGSVRFLTDTNGAVTDTFDYDAFGNLIAHTGATPNLYLFRGEQFDSDLNFYYLRARYHNPATGRFWTADNFEGFAADLASQHHYTFNQNDPVNRIDPSGHISLAETLQVSGLAPLVRGAFLNLWDGVNNFMYGMAGGNALKFTSREEAYFIDSLAVGPGWKFGKPNFWATAKGAPFLLSLNPNIWQGKKPCYYDCILFDQDVPVYGPGAQHPLFEFEQTPLYGLVEKIGHHGTAPLRFIGGAGVAAGVAGKTVADLVVNTGGAVSYVTASSVYGSETAERFFGKQADATAALALGLGRLNLATASLFHQPLLNVVAPEFADAQRDLLGATAQAAWSGFTGGDAAYAGLGWEFRAGFTAFNLLGLVQGAAEMTHALQAAKAARLSARLIAAESAGQMGAMRALRINQTAAEAAEAAAALTGPAKTGCRAARPVAVIDLAEGPDGVLVPISELKNQRLLAANNEEPKIGQALEPQRTGAAADFENSLPGAASDVASQKRIVPTLDFDNPNPRGNNFVKFDGQDFQDPDIFIDRKLNVTTRPKQVADIQRVAEALRQNPTASLVIEVPNEAARRAALRLLNKAGQASNPQITVRIVQ